MKKTILISVICLLLFFGSAEAGFFDWLFEKTNAPFASVSCRDTMAERFFFKLSPQFDEANKKVKVFCPSGAAGCSIYMVKDVNGQTITPIQVAMCSGNNWCEATFIETKIQIPTEFERNYYNFLNPVCPVNALKCQLVTYTSGGSETVRSECNPGQNCWVQAGSSVLQQYDWKGYAIKRPEYTAVQNIKLICPEGTTVCKYDFKGSCSQCIPNCNGEFNYPNVQIVSCNNLLISSYVDFWSNICEAQGVEPPVVTFIIPAEFSNGYSVNEQVKLTIKVTNINDGGVIDVILDDGPPRSLAVYSGKVEYNAGILSKGYHTITVQAGGTKTSQRIQVLSAFSDIALTWRKEDQPYDNIVVILTVKDERGKPLSYRAGDFTYTITAKYDDNTPLIFKELIDNYGSHDLIFSGSKEGNVNFQVTVSAGGYKPATAKTTVYASKNVIKITFPSDFPDAVKTGDIKDICVYLKNPIDGSALTSEQVSELSARLYYPTGNKVDNFVKSDFTSKGNGLFCLVGYKFSTLTTNVELYTFEVKASAAQINLYGNSVTKSITVDGTGSLKLPSDMVVPCKSIKIGGWCTGISVGNIIMVVLLILIIFLIVTRVFL